ARDATLAAAIARAIVSIDPALFLVGLAGSALLDAGTVAGLRTVSEAFADRAYRSNGTLVPRSEPGAVIHAVERVASRAVWMVLEQTVEAIEGARVPIHVQTLCLHGDTPDAGAMARAVRRALEAAGVTIRAYAA